MARRQNPRYVLFARAHGHTPAQQSRHDKAAYPGGCNTGFVLWIGQAWTAWAKSRGFSSGRDACHALGLDNRGAWFDEWLRDELFAGRLPPIEKSMNPKLLTVLDASVTNGA